MKLHCIYSSVPSKPTGNIFIACHMEFGLAQSDEVILWTAPHLSALLRHIEQMC